MALSAGHHGTKIVHEGDEFKALDYGIFQLGTTITRIEANANLFMSLTHFGHHMIHHMFPSLDHSLLPHLIDIMMETCNEFKGELRECSLLEALIEQFKQLGRKDTFKLNLKT